MLPTSAIIGIVIAAVFIPCYFAVSYYRSMVKARDGGGEEMGGGAGGGAGTGGIGHPVGGRNGGDGGGAGGCGGCGGGE